MSIPGLPQVASKSRCNRIHDEDDVDGLGWSLVPLLPSVVHDAELVRRSPQPLTRVVAGAGGGIGMAVVVGG